MQDSNPTSILEAIKRLDLRTAEVGEIVSLLKKAGSDRFTFSGAIKYPPSFYCRLRAGSDVYSTVQALSYPKGAQKWGRCNRPGEPMFYCGNSPLHLPKEIDAKPGQAVTLGYWRAQHKALVAVFGFSQRVRDRLGTLLRPAKGDEASMRPQQTQHLQALHDFLEEALTSYVAIDESYKYKLTVALTDFLTAQELSQRIAPDINGFVGIQYPAVVSDGNHHNYAFRGSFVDSSMELFRVEAFNVQKVQGTDYQLNPLATGEPMPDGSIEWSEFESIFTVESTIGELRIEHGNPTFRIHGPKGEAVGF